MITLRKTSVETLVQEVRAFQKEGYRLVQIGATRLPEVVELTYSFDKESRMEHIRLDLPSAAAHLPSISSIYWCAFLYENELHDLFGVQVEGLAVDFHGNFYKTSVKFPFGSTKPPKLKPASTPQVPVAAAGVQPTTPA